MIVDVAVISHALLRRLKMLTHLQSKTFINITAILRYTANQQLRNTVGGTDGQLKASAYRWSFFDLCSNS